MFLYVTDASLCSSEIVCVFFFFFWVFCGVVTVVMVVVWRQFLSIASEEKKLLLLTTKHESNCDSDNNKVIQDLFLFTMNGGPFIPPQKVQEHTDFYPLPSVRTLCWICFDVEESY